MAGGETSPLGARALYLGKTVYRIHGTNQPSTIGTFVSSGCIRLTKEDVMDLYGRIQVGTLVVLPGRSSATAAATSLALVCPSTPTRAPPVVILNSHQFYGVCASLMEHSSSGRSASIACTQLDSVCVFRAVHTGLVPLTPSLGADDSSARIRRADLAGFPDGVVQRNAEFGLSSRLGPAAR